MINKNDFDKAIKKLPKKSISILEIPKDHLLIVVEPITPHFWNDNRRQRIIMEDDRGERYWIFND